jgi:hypothetical protein
MTLDGDVAADGSKHYAMALDGVFEISNCYNIRVL